ncbi:hypothetical protein NDS46_29935 (plasmid) [Paenibacillus thiaminolyticus]|uniref:hypothetical protein n=1 Tax=Paenibacillus thiaminolyticus TaxID=49283 RepID=UPI00232CB8C3|nr:hypothetical protein [Paenibacillus thiaminolyticus]WCF11569.1 hypothetical protein NDS46_29935 [Paenibacillus thiaminolyticus]
MLFGSTEVYPREEKKVDGLTHEQLTEAMTLYTNKIKADIIVSLESTYGIRLDIDDEDEMLSYFNYVMDMAFTKGMELATDRGRLTDYYKEVKQIEIDKVSTYEFEIDKGVSGVLFPDGEFKKCGNAEHHCLLYDIPFDVQVGCLYFSSTLFGDENGLITHTPMGFKGITEVQKKWMKDHFKYFDRGQKQVLKGEKCSLF